MMERPVDAILDAGDLAFAAKDTHTLSLVAQELFPAVSAPLQVVLRDITSFLKSGHTRLAWEWWLEVSSTVRAHMIAARAYTHNFVN